MNKRIRELSERALEIVSNKRMLNDGQLERTWDPDEYDQVFAELIVRECAEICLEANDHKNILRHFGVEQ